MLIWLIHNLVPVYWSCYYVSSLGAVHKAVAYCEKRCMKECLNFQKPTMRSESRILYEYFFFSSMVFRRIINRLGNVCRLNCGQYFRTKELTGALYWDVAESLWQRWASEGAAALCRSTGHFQLPHFLMFLRITQCLQKGCTCTILKDSDSSKRNAYFWFLLHFVWENRRVSEMIFHRSDWKGIHMNLV